MPEPRLPYPTDLTDHEWALLEPLVPAPKAAAALRFTPDGRS